MGYWRTRGLRGSTLEEMINLTNDRYRDKKLALIQKVPTPITPIEMGAGNTVSLAYFEKKSTVDYIGVVQGVPVCFDAKETTGKSFPLKNIHAHQMEFMEDFERQKGLAFLLVSFTAYKEIYLLPLPVISRFWRAAAAGGRKSIPYDEFDKQLVVENKNGFMVHYLEAVNTVLVGKTEG